MANPEGEWGVCEEMAEAVGMAYGGDIPFGTFRVLVRYVVGSWAGQVPHVLATWPVGS